MSDVKEQSAHFVNFGGNSGFKNTGSSRNQCNFTANKTIDRLCDYCK